MGPVFEIDFGGVVATGGVTGDVDVVVAPVPVLAFESVVTVLEVIVVFGTSLVVCEVDAVSRPVILE